MLIRLSEVEVGHRIFRVEGLSLKEHLHEYNDDWKCKCGQKLVVETLDGKIRVKGFVAPDGKFVPISETRGAVEGERKPAKTTEENKRKVH